jgi:hypothetical protein
MIHRCGTRQTKPWGLKHDRVTTLSSCQAVNLMHVYTVHTRVRARVHGSADLRNLVFVDQPVSEFISPVFAKTSLKKFIFNKLKRAFWACFCKNWVGHRVQCVLFRGTDGTGTTEKTSEVRNSLTDPERLLIYVGDDEWPMLIANSTVHIFQNSRSLITWHFKPYIWLTVQDPGGPDSDSDSDP